MSLIDPHKLVPNPANAIFDDLPADIYEALKADIAHRGLLNPILVTSNFTVIAGHHRLRAALELGLEQVSVDIQDVDPEEAEDRLIADNVLRRQLSLGEQARLIRRLKERAGVKRGNNQFLGGASAIMAEAPELAQASERKQRRLDHANDLIPPLFAMFSAKTLSMTAADALAGLSHEEQQALFDTLGAAGVASVKAADVQAAKRESQPSHTESEIRAILNRVKDLQSQKDALESQLASQVDPGDLQDQLDALAAERDALQEQVSRLQNAPPTITERVIEKMVPTPDPELARRIDELQKRVADAQRQALAAEQKRDETKSHYLARLKDTDAASQELADQLQKAQAALKAVGQSRNAEDIAAVHGGTLLFQVRQAAAPLLSAWPKLVPLSIHCRLPDIDASAEIQGIAEQLSGIVEALHRVLADNAAEPTTVIEAVARDATDALPPEKEGETS